MGNFGEQYEWFLPARVLRAQKTGVSDRLLQIIATARPLPLYNCFSEEVVRCPVSSMSGVSEEIVGSAQSLLLPERMCPASGSSEELIDRFLACDNLRIVAEQGDAAEEILTEATIGAEDDLATEELAEIYLEQGLTKKAIKIYRRLGLENPKKSAYFAALIKKIKT